MERVFECICGNIGEDEFIYDYDMADGEVWKCNNCKENIIVEFEN